LGVASLRNRCRCCPPVGHTLSSYIFAGFPCLLAPHLLRMETQTDGADTVTRNAG
jgi:hypothetical protein